MLKKKVIWLIWLSIILIQRREHLYKKEVPFTRSGHVDTTKLGSYTLRYKVDQGSLNR